MSPLALLAHTLAEGVTVRAEAGALKAAPSSKLSSDLRDQLRAQKPALLMLLTTLPLSGLDAPAVADRLEAWAERAAIMEYCGGLPRAEAEAEAWRRVVQ